VAIVPLQTWGNMVTILGDTCSIALKGHVFIDKVVDNQHGNGADRHICSAGVCDISQYKKHFNGTNIYEMSLPQTEVEKNFLHLCGCGMCSRCVNL